ncbi:transglutaminase [Paenibacillus pectinilyticus]|uniref:Transglutaminase n=1 Tax=Paenibacillus pectinilyticus TaxID=512399 RepID=A0A1C0ZZD4_9BACL|nr:transglutaminase family protein [Paenibacillus pectinilyticus]OCT13475.1 transglutaminase [Paenibacillus pectinilyticus]
MILTCESNQVEDYLCESKEVDYRSDAIRGKAEELFAKALDEIDFVRKSFEFVRDEISHSWDIQSSRVTCRASEVLHFKEGICYAKSNLLCAILRSKGLPTGFCYQRLTLGDMPESGYCLHALNAVYLQSVGKWIRLDARGNKPGIQAEFALEEEKLAFSVRAAYDEIDYPLIYSRPNPDTMSVLQHATDCITMYNEGLPTSL